MSTAEHHTPESAPSPIRTRTRESLVALIFESMQGALPNPLQKSTVATEVRNLAVIVTKRPVAGFHNNRFKLFSLEDQREIARRVIANLSDARVPDKASLTAQVLTLLDSEKGVTAPAPVKERIKEPAGISVETLLARKDISKMKVGRGYFGVFELLDANGTPVHSPEGKSIYFEFGRPTRTSTIAHRIDASGRILGPEIYLDEFPKYAHSLGGARVRELKGTHSSVFDFSHSASKR